MSDAAGSTRKNAIPKSARVLRGIWAAIDPRAWLHLLRMVNYWNYTHVAQKRLAHLSKGVTFSPDVVMSNAERIEIGDGSNIGSRCILWAGHEHAKIRIGRQCLFGPEVMLTAASYRYNDGAPVAKQAMDEADIVIEDDVWLGTRVIVLPGVTIGRGAIVGAGALVREDIPPFAIAVGQPARVVGQREVVELTDG